MFLVLEPVRIPEDNSGPNKLLIVGVFFLLGAMVALTYSAYLIVKDSEKI